MQKGFIVPALIIAFAVVLIAGGLLGAFYFGKKSSGPTSTNPVVQQEQPTPVSGETANWKTYTDQENGYSLKYPPEWRLEVRGASTYIYSDYTCGHECGGYYIWIETEQSAKRYDLETLTFQEDIINNLNVLRTRLPSIVGAARSILFKRDGNGIYVSFWPYIEGHPELEKYHGEFNQILSTFKFTN